jgi:peptidyl-prolyl cis-trans isomerase C
MRAIARRFAREPLLHFVVIGAALVAVHTAVGPTGTSRRIEVDDSMRRALRQEQMRRTGTPPTAEEEQLLIERYVDDEILYREALALGLDRGDVIVRRRLLQKMEFLAESSEPIPEPTDLELEALLAEEGERYAVEPRVTLAQVYVSTDRHGASAAERAREIRSELEAGADPATLGDPFPRGREFGPATRSELAGIFGSDFAERAMDLPVGRWSEPVRSSYGFHLILPSARLPGGPARLADVRSAVRLDWLERKRARRRRDALDALRERYVVRTEP